MIKYMVILFLIFQSVMTVQAGDIGWGIPRSKDEMQPYPGERYDTLIRQNDAFYIGSPDKKIIYLTFDTGYEVGNTTLILDVLKKHNVPTTFFVTGSFITKEPLLLQRMVNEGHLIGNHTWSHPDLTQISQEEFNQELSKVEAAYHALTNQTLVKVMRPPEGRLSQQMLDYAKQRGYYNIMWSLAYVDWNIHGQKGWQYAYEEILDRIHPGAIILMHSVSSDNAKALDHLIPALREKGYEFKSLQYLMTEDAIEPLN